MAKTVITPKVEFVYSWIYDEHWRGLWHAFKWGKKLKRPYPSIKKTTSYFKKIIPAWNRQEYKIVREIAIVTGFKWKEKQSSAILWESADHSQRR